MTEEKIAPNGDRRPNGWRMSKEISISFVAVAAIQTIGFAIWLTDLGSTVKSIVLENAASKISAYTKDDARKDRELQDSRLERIKDKEDEITRRTALLEAQFNELRARVVK